MDQWKGSFRTTFYPGNLAAGTFEVELPKKPVDEYETQIKVKHTGFYNYNGTTNGVLKYTTKGKMVAKVGIFSINFELDRPQNENTILITGKYNTSLPPDSGVFEMRKIPK